MYPARCSVVVASGNVFLHGLVAIAQQRKQQTAGPFGSRNSQAADNHTLLYNITTGAAGLIAVSACHQPFCNSPALCSSCK